MFVFLTISLVERKCETSYLFISLFMYFWIELQKFQSRLKTKNSGNIWKQISQNISCREMRFSPQSSNKLYLLQKDFLRKGFSYYHFRKKPSGGQLLKMIKSAAENVFFWKDLCLLVDFLLTRNRQSFVHQSEEGQGGYWDFHAGLISNKF